LVFWNGGIPKFTSHMIKNIHGRTLELLGEAVVAGRYAIGASNPPRCALRPSARAPKKSKK
jgi:hypothetical protein